MLATILACGIAVVRWRRDRGIYALCTLGGALFFLFILRYQPWITRLQIPFFLMGMPLLVVVLQGLPLVRAGAVFLLLIAGLPTPIFNFMRPLVGERSVFLLDDDRELFASQPDRQISYRIIAEKIAERHPARVAIVADKESWEWPLSYCLIKMGKPLPWFGHLNVQNETAPLERTPPWSGITYDAIVMIDRWDDFLDPAFLAEYDKVFEDGNLRLFFRK